MNDLSIYDFLSLLDDAEIHYQIGRYFNDALTVCIAIPGERIEINFSNNGMSDIAIFGGDECSSVLPEDLIKYIDSYANEGEKSPSFQAYIQSKKSES